MKKHLIVYSLLLFIVPHFYVACNNPVVQPLYTASGNDTLYTTIVRYDTTHYQKLLFRLVSQKSATDFDTSYSDTAPPTTEMTAFGQSENCLNHSIPPEIINTTIPVFDTRCHFVDNPESRDTVVIINTLEKKHITYKDTITCRIDTIATYFSNTKPFFTSNDSIAHILSTAIEGYTHCIRIHALHFENDSASIRLIDNPPWVELYRMSMSEGYGGCWFYPLCMDGLPVESGCMRWVAKRRALTEIYTGCFKPHILFKADSTALDSIYNWKIVITNKYARSDTMHIATNVTPFPDSLRCR